MRKAAQLFTLLLVLFFALTLTGCDMTDQAVLQAVHQYFPTAKIFRFDKRVLWIQANVTGISPQFATKTFSAFLQEPQIGQLRMGMNFSGQRFFVLSFNPNAAIVWDQSGSGNYWTLDWAQLNNFWQQSFGYQPAQLFTQPGSVVVVQ